jgi:hypothetical protein
MLSFCDSPCIVFLSFHKQRFIVIHKIFRSFHKIGACHAVAAFIYLYVCVREERDYGSVLSSIFYNFY